MVVTITRIGLINTISINFRTTLVIAFIVISNNIVIATAPTRVVGVSTIIVNTTLATYNSTTFIHNPNPSPPSNDTMFIYI
jgi:hypothetical protein